MIKLGNKVRDKVSGFEGIATAKVEFINGCIQFCVKPKITKDNKGKMPEGEYIDQGQLIVTGEGIAVKPKEKGPGGVMRDIPGDTYRG